MTHKLLTTQEVEAMIAEKGGPVSLMVSDDQLEWKQAEVCRTAMYGARYPFAGDREWYKYAAIPTSDEHIICGHPQCDRPATTAMLIPTTEYVPDFWDDTRVPYTHQSEYMPHVHAVGHSRVVGLCNEHLRHAQLKYLECGESLQYGDVLFAPVAGSVERLTSMLVEAGHPAVCALTGRSPAQKPDGFDRMRQALLREPRLSDAVREFQRTGSVPSLYAEGTKHDEGKPRWSLLPLDTITQVVAVLEHGAKKYGDDNWRYVENGRTRYYDALMRHVDAWWRGEDNDPDSGLPHLAHAACCILFLMARCRDAK